MLIVRDIHATGTQFLAWVVRPPYCWRQFCPSIRLSHLWEA